VCEAAGELLCKRLVLWSSPLALNQCCSWAIAAFQFGSGVEAWQGTSEKGKQKWGVGQ